LGLRKAVSPIVAVTLIIIISVAASVILFSWLHGSVGNDEGASRVGQERLVVKAASLDPAGGTLTVYVQNVGHTAGRVDTVYLLDANGNIVYQWNVSATIDPGYTEALTLTLPPSLPESTEYRVLVGGSSSTAAPFTVDLAEFAGCPPPGWNKNTMPCCPTACCTI